MWVISLAVLVSAVGGSVMWAVHLFRIASRDSLELAAKLATPHPRRAADWPELHLDEVVFDPAAASRVLLVARWPAHPDRRVLLDLDVDAHSARARDLLVHWCAAAASLSPTGGADDHLVLRRRRSTETVTAGVVGESSWRRSETRSYNRG